MASQQFNITSGGGIEIVLEDGDGTKRSVVFEPDDNGNVAITGRGPNGEKSGKIDPSGGGNNSLGT